MSATPPPPVDKQKPHEEHRFPCEQCGADMRFSPQAGRLICDHCGAAHEIDAPGPWERAIRELDFGAAIKNLLPGQEVEESRFSKCTSCGAEIGFDGETHAAECPFCATPIVTDTGTHRHIKPRGVLPFALDEEQAREAMKDWLGGLWFAPTGLQNYARKGRAMQGIYVPYWTYDAQTRTDYSGARGTVYTEMKSSMQGGKMTMRPVTKVRWRAVSGRVSRFFDDVLVLASHSLPKRYTDALEPWDLSALEPYQPEFLAGFIAEAYQVDLEDGFEQAQEKMHRQILRDIKFDIGGDRQRVNHVKTHIDDVTFKHVLLPVWMAAYRFRGQSYRFVVNGRTGRVQGERPWSIWKISLAVLVGLGLAGALGYWIAISQ